MAIMFVSFDVKVNKLFNVDVFVQLFIWEILPLHLFGTIVDLNELQLVALCCLKKLFKLRKSGYCLEHPEI